METISSRTQLYSLAPIAISKPAVESLSSYVVRLAAAHSVKISHLEQYLGLVDSGQGQGILKCPANAFNGGMATRRWLPALEEGTNIRELRFMTMLPFGKFVGYHRSFHWFRRWCPNCYEDSRKEFKTTYDPLLWSTSSVDICPIHLTDLVNTCPTCAWQMRCFPAFMRAGYCSKCCSWLGRTQSATLMTGNELDRRIWYAKAFGNLLSMGPQLADDSTTALFVNNWRALLHIVRDRFRNAVLQVCGISAPVRDRMLLEPPVVDVLLRMSFGLKLDIRSLVERDFNPENMVRYLSQATKCIVFPRPAISRKSLRGLLEDALNESPAPSLAELAVRWGYSGTNRLREVDSDLCKRISTRNSEGKKRTLPWKAMSQEKIQLARTLLEAAIRQESPDPCGTIARQVGCEVKTLSARFPELCHSVSEKIQEAKKSRSAHAQQLLEYALTVGPVPSLNALAKQAGYRCSTSLKQNFPELYERVLQRARSNRCKEHEELALKLDSYLHETPPPTVREITGRVLLCEATLVERYPILMEQLATRSKKHQSESTVVRRNQVFTEVRRIVEADLLDGQTTVFGERLRTLISNDCPKSWTLRWRALQAARQHLETEGKSLPAALPG